MENVQKILFFCRGRGRGHAIPDLEIATSLKQLRPNLELIFASYATGAEVLRQHGMICFDMGLEETPDYLAVQSRAYQIISETNPSWVVVHEEFGALSAAKLLGHPTIFLSDWLPPAGTLSAESLRFADSVVLFCEPGIFPVPSSICAEVRYASRFVRRMVFKRGDQAKAREELGIDSSDTVLAVIPGGWATEARMPISQLVLGALDHMEQTVKSIFWITTRDRTVIEAYSGVVPGLIVPDSPEPLERIIVASDLVITKGNRGSIMEAAWLGVPSLAISTAKNPIDDTLISRIRTNLTCSLGALSPPVLGREFDRILSSSAPLGYDSGVKINSGATEVAAILLNELVRLRRHA